MRGYRRRKESEARLHLENARWQVWATLSPHTKKGKSISLQDIVRFDWEQDKAGDKRKDKQRKAAEFWKKVDEKNG